MNHMNDILDNHVLKDIILVIYHRISCTCNHRWLRVYEQTYVCHMSAHICVSYMSTHICVSYMSVHICVSYMSAHICVSYMSVIYMSSYECFHFKIQDHPGGVHNLNFGDRVMSDHDSNVLFVCERPWWSLHTRVDWLFRETFVGTVLTVFLSDYNTSFHSSFLTHCCFFWQIETHHFTSWVSLGFFGGFKRVVFVRFDCLFAKLL
jgi:hypothetical protein